MYMSLPVMHVVFMVILCLCEHAVSIPYGLPGATATYKNGMGKFMIQCLSEVYEVQGNYIG